MTTSGTYDFNPSLGELTLFAFDMCGIRSAELLQEHMRHARMAANLLLGRWAAGPGVPLWAIDLQTIPLVQGQATYDVEPSTVGMLDAYVVQNEGGAAINRLILPISRSEYASYPNPQQQGFPTTYWFDRLLAPTVTLWPVPDGSVSAFNFYRLRRIQDANFTGGQTVEIPNFFLEAFAAGLAYRLSIIYAPEKQQGLKAFADESYEIASSQDIENSAIYIAPQMSGYFRP